MGTSILGRLTLSGAALLTCWAWPAVAAEMELLGLEPPLPLDMLAAAERAVPRAAANPGGSAVASPEVQPAATPNEGRHNIREPATQPREGDRGGSSARIGAASPPDAADTLHSPPPTPAWTVPTPMPRHGVFLSPDAAPVKSETTATTATPPSPADASGVAPPPPPAAAWTVPPPAPRHKAEAPTDADRMTATAIVPAVTVALPPRVAAGVADSAQPPPPPDPMWAVPTPTPRRRAGILTGMATAPMTVAEEAVASVAVSPASANPFLSVLAHTLETHVRIKAAEADLKAGVATLGKTRGGLFPTLKVTSDAGRQAIDNPGETPDTNLPTRHANFSASQLLWD
ncbi:MAG: hypothetical protein HQL66_11445, partial [Magnetococcales bacterium]|nr:hypothetical protein [Magnetococcales bacterium]